MKKQDTLTALLKQDGIPGFMPASEAVLWRKCRHCGKSFKPAKAFYVCCSWNCQQAYTTAQAELDALDRAEYKGHPF
jgi:hypothetical protein